jgi:hypothetical protein
MKAKFILCLLFALSVLSAGCSSALRSKPGDVVFLGTATEVLASPQGQESGNWVVTFSVEKIYQGTLPGDTFSFRLQNPLQSGIIKGLRYRVIATPTPDGYTVNPDQWIR